MHVDNSLLAQLRDRLGNDTGSIIADSMTLQRKAVEKFGDGVWCVTARALQQSTTCQVAMIKSHWFGDDPVADLCCGIGGDSMWLAKRGPIIAVDLDPEMIACATANHRESGAASLSAKFICDDAIVRARSWEHAVHIDPDRRMGNKRTSTPEYYTPPWSDVLRVIERAPAAVVKLAPAAELDTTSIGRPVHRTWFSLRGSVREQSLLIGDAITRAQVPEKSTRGAIAIRSGRPISHFFGSENDERATIVSQPASWLVDPDPAIRAAGLSDAFAIRYAMNVIGSPSGFLTTDSSVASRVMANFGRVEWSGSSDERKLKKEMRLRGVYPAVVKVRGADRDPEKIIRAMKDCGERPVTLWFGRVGKKIYAAWTSLDATAAV